MDRLVAVVPKEFLDLIDTAKAQTDLWINLWFLSLLTIADAILTWRFPMILLAGDKLVYLKPLLAQLVVFVNAYGHLPVMLSADKIAPYFQLLLTCAGAIAIAFFASLMGARAAIEWGSTFKAAIDVFLPALYDRLGFPAPANREDAEARWAAFSYAITYRTREAMPDRRWVASIPPPGAPPAPPASDQAGPASPGSPAAVKTVTKSDPITSPAKTGSLPARPTNGLRRSMKDGSPTSSRERASAPAVPSDHNRDATDGKAQTPTEHPAVSSSLAKTREKER